MNAFLAALFAPLTVRECLMIVPALIGCYGLLGQCADWIHGRQRRREMRAGDSAGAEMSAPTRPVIAPRPETAYDITLRQCEAQWGPFSRWTREQHRAHTAMLCRAVGIDETRARAETAP